jgi:hypothetical protein
MSEEIAYDAEWDAGDLGCGDLVLELRGRLRALEPGAPVAGYRSGSRGGHPRLVRADEEPALRRCPTLLLDLPAAVLTGARRLLDSRARAP